MKRDQIANKKGGLSQNERVPLFNQDLPKWDHKDGVI